MKKLFLVLLAFVFLLAGCKMFESFSGSDDDDSTASSSTGTDTTGNTETTVGAPSKISITGAKGVYLTSSSIGTASSSRSLASGRSVISITTSSLCCVKATGETAAATFTDDNDNVISVSITKAAQLDDDYILLTYTYTDSESVTQTVTSSLSVSDGTLHELSVTPANWERIFARGTLAWFESGGSIYKCILSSGTCTVISSSAETYCNDGTSRDLSDNGVTASWSSDAWIFANTGSDVFVFDGSYQSFQAQAITSTGVKKDFGYQNEAYTFFESLANHNCLWDDNTNSFYTTKVRPIHDNNVLAPSGLSETGGYCIQLYPIGLDADSTGDVMTLNFSSYAAAGVAMHDDNQANYCLVGNHAIMDETIMTYGNYSYSATPTAIYEYCTSSVPISHTSSSGTTNENAVYNWLYSGSAVYAGPDDDTDEIDIMEFNSGSVTIKTLVSGTNVESWTVVGDVLFYTNTSGQTYKAAIDTSTCTCATPTYYSDTEVIGITQ